MSKLEEAFASPPGRPGRFVHYIDRRGDVDGLQTAVVIFAARYAARKWLTALLEDDEWVWEGENILKTSSGLIIRGDTVRESFDHELTLAEMAWVLPDPYPGLAKRLRYGRAPTVAPEAKARTHRSGAPRASRAGLTSIADIAVALNIEARDARAALRRAKVEKPAAGWAWPYTEVEAVKALIMGARK